MINPKKPIKNTTVMSQYLKNNKEGYISNKFGIQRHPKTKEIVDGLAVTTLTDDYIPPIILAKTPEGQTYIVDGGSRTAAFLMIRYGNHKIKTSVENPIIKYNKMSKATNPYGDGKACERIVEAILYYFKLQEERPKDM